MVSSEERGSTARPCIYIKRLDPAIVNRTHEYPGLAKGTKILVVGDGAVAASARSLLKAAGCQVTALYKSATAAATPGCLVVEGSPTSPDSCAKAVAGQEVVVHAGGPSCVAASWECVTSGTRNLVDIAAAAGVKGFVLASSVRFGAPLLSLAPHRSCLGLCYSPRWQQRSNRKMRVLLGVRNTR